MRSLISLLVAFALTGCGAIGQRSMAFPSMSFVGPYASQWTVDDVRQVQALIRGRTDIQKPIGQVVANKPDEAEIKSDPKKTGDLMTTLIVRKRDGRWHIIEKTVSTGKALITG